jgi:hypothetical protein
LIETFKGRAHMPGVENEWIFLLSLDWKAREAEVQLEGLPGHINTWQGLQVQTFGDYEIAFKTKGIPPVLTHWWHLVRAGENNLTGLIIGLPDNSGTWTTCPIGLTKFVVV